jgi:hypothetical protein
MHEPAIAVDLADEIAQHRLRDVEVGDHAILQGADGRNRSGRTPQHLLGREPDSLAVLRIEHLVGAFAHRNYRRLV